VQQLPFGRLELVRIGKITLGRATYEPGWRWSEHVGRSPEDRCPVEHLGVVLSGQVAVVGDGYDEVMGPGDVFAVPPGHDSWVVGNEPYVALHVLGSAGDAAG
jgi:quercetin dioxygenase-like cupin family protein